MLNHFSLGVADLARAARFYDAVLSTLGYGRVWTRPDGIGYGEPRGEDRLALKERAGTHPPGAGCHLAIAAPSRAAVRAFHASALAHGGQDDGPPGPRPQYGPAYYAAFAIDPDGYRIEAVINHPDAAADTIPWLRKLTGFSLHRRRKP